jgi:hypothetical protein
MEFGSSSIFAISLAAGVGEGRGVCCACEETVGIWKSKKEDNKIDANIIYIV